MRWFPATAVLTGCAILALAGCATASAPQTSAAQTSAAQTSAAQTSAAQTSTPQTSAPQRRAVADAAFIRASFAAPPGARRLTRAPAAGGGVLGRLPIPGLPDEVDLTSWWQVPGQPVRVLRWEQAHLPRRFAPAGGSAGDGLRGASSEQDEEFSLPTVPGVLYQRELIITVVDAGGGQTAVRVDGWVIWTAARSPAERVPASARVVSAEVVPGNEPRGAAPRRGPVLITGPAAVARITAFIDGLPRAPTMAKSCPAFSPGVVRVAFMARIGGPPLAVFTVELSRCYADFTVNGKPQPDLSPDPSVPRQLLALTGLRLAGY